MCAAPTTHYPHYPHYLQIRLRNEKIRTKMLKVDGARDALLGMGWVSRVEQMEEKLVWDKDEADFPRLELGVHELKTRVASIKAKASDDPKEKEARERATVMTMIKTDKEDRHARALAAKEAEGHRVGEDGTSENTFQHRRIRDVPALGNTDSSDPTTTSPANPTDNTTGQQ